MTSSDKASGPRTRGIETIYPLTALQQGMLFHTQLSEEPGMYWAQHGLLLEGPLNVPALRAAWELVFSRHEVLRTTVLWEGVPQPLAVVSRSVELPIEVEDLSGLPDETARRAAVAGFLERDWRRGADFSAPTLSRLAVLSLTGDRHQLVWSYHHLLLDGWSMAIVLGEVLEAYRELRAGRRPKLPARAPFREFVAWAAKQDANEARSYWAERLASFTEPTTLGVERATGRHGVAEIEVELSEAAATGLGDFARRHRLTLNTVMHGAWALVLGRYAGGVDDVVFGVTSSGRSGQVPGVDGMVGMLMNTTPVRIRVDREAPVAHWLGELQREQLRAREFEHTPLVDVVACSGVAPGQNLLSTLFVFENYPAHELEEGHRRSASDGLSVGANHGRELDNFPLTVTAGSRNGLIVRMTYDRARFEDEAVTAMAACMADVLNAVVLDDGRAVGDLPLVSEDERKQLIHGWNTTTAPREAPGICQRIAAWAQEDPDSIAVVADGVELTFAELTGRAYRLAHYLRAQEVGAESVVGLCLERGVDLVTSILAVWYAGGAYVSLDPDYPADRLAYMLADSGVSLLLGHRSVAEALAADIPAGTSVRWLDDDPNGFAAELVTYPDAAPDISIHEESLAAVIYTSGSTGRPKGTLTTHGNLAAVYHAWETDGCYFKPGDRLRWLTLASASFDVFTGDLVRALAAGGALVLGRPGLQLEVADWMRLLTESRVGAFECAPRYVDELVEHLAATGTTLDALRLLVVTTELWRTGAAARARDVFGERVRVLTAYGLTETTIDSTASTLQYALSKVPDDEDRATPIGRPLPGTRIYVLDARLEPVPVGVTGELWIAGAQLARGYGGRPAHTAERFVADPHADGARMYRSGDRARWTEHGEIEFLGRADQQLKLRGFRIEPGEIEAALTAHPAVRASVVTVLGEGPEQRLAAFLVPAASDFAPGCAFPAAAELRSLLRCSLPEFMIPAVFMTLGELPLSPNGKVDRRALPAAAMSADATALEPGGLAAELTPTQELLAGIWARVLDSGRESASTTGRGIGPQDGFFDLGGHSLLAVRVASQIREVFGVQLPLATVLGNTRLDALAAAIDGFDRDAAADAQPPAITPVPRDEPLPLSFAQQRLWFLDQLDPGSAAYIAPSYIWLDERPDVDALGRALAALTERHEVLRTRLVADGNGDGVPRQVIVAAPESYPLPVLDVSGAADPEREARRLAALETTTPFDLAVGPPLRATLIRSAEDTHLLLVVVHHIAFDEWSARIFRTELWALYDAILAGEPNPSLALPPLPVQYADFAAWQHRWLTGEVLENQVGYWRDQLADLATLDLPTDRPRPAVQSSEGAVLGFEVSPATAAALRALARESGVTMFMATLAAFSTVLGRWCGTDDVAVGTPVANRMHAGTENLIGFFVNTLVLRTDLSGDPTFRRLLDRSRRTALDAYAHQDAPFEQLVDELVNDRDRSRNPLFQVLFSFVPNENGASGAQRSGSLAVKFDLAVTLSDSADGGLSGVVEFSTALFDVSTVERLSQGIVALLDAAAVDGERPLSALPVAAASELKRVVEDWNGVLEQLPSVSGVHELILDRAGQTPDAIAVVCGDEHLTFGGMAERAGSVAARLRERGVGAESRVAISVPRGVDMVVAVLGVWMAGAAYVPLDPAYPADRLAFMLADSGALLLDEVRSLWAADGPAYPAPEIDASQAAYVIYTSGSTGRPKGVLVSHAAALGMATGLTSVLAVRPGAAMLQFASLSFDAAVLDLVVGLSSGARLVIAREEERTDSALLTALVCAQAVAVASVVPSLLAAVDPFGWDAVETLVVGSETLSGSLASVWASPGRRLVNTYGPTETAVMVTAGEVEAADLLGASPPLGRATANVRLYVVDDRFSPSPVGVTGELCIAGPQLARGYHGRSALTAERFVADPFAADGSRMYRTGDRAKWLADGRLAFAGRADHQVKVRGLRIEPGEIQDALETHPAISTAVVVAVGSENARRLGAYLVPADQDAGIPSVAELREHLRSRLPEYMVPSVFAELAAVPLSPNGKLDLGALPEFDSDSIDDGEIISPDGPAEETLAEIWGEVLGMSEVSVERNFFELGGHSMLATQIISRAREAFEMDDLNVSMLFEAPTVRGLAAVIEDRLWAEIENMTEAEVLQSLDAPLGAQSDEDGVETT